MPESSRQLEKHKKVYTFAKMSFPSAMLNSPDPTCDPEPQHQLTDYEERREQRLRRRRQWERDRRASETAGQKEARLAKCRERHFPFSIYQPHPLC